MVDRCLLFRYIGSILQGQTVNNYIFITLLAWPTLGSAAQLLQCPDWQQLVANERTAVLRTQAASSSDFNAALERARVSTEPSGDAPMDSTGIAGRVITTATLANCSYTIASGDTLAKIAAAQLGNAGRWTELARINKSTLPNPSNLRVGAQILLPCAGSVAGQNTVVAPAAVPAPPQPAPVPVWTAQKGEHFTTVITRWAAAAGYTVVLETNEDWQFSVPVNEQGSFRDVLQRVVRGLAAQGTAPAVQVFNNNVVKIGA